MSLEKGFVEIASVLVNPEIFTRPYSCDVEKYGCKSMCCYRSCIVPPQEAKRIEAHFDGILGLPVPGEPGSRSKRTAASSAYCKKQCPTGCEIHEDEAQAIRGTFGGADFRCVLCPRQDLLPALYEQGRPQVLRRAHLRHGQGPGLGGVQVRRLRPVSPLLLYDRGRQEGDVHPGHALPEPHPVHDRTRRASPCTRASRRPSRPFWARNSTRNSLHGRRSITKSNRSLGPSGNGYFTSHLYLWYNLLRS